MLKDIQKEVDDLKKTLLPLLGNERTNFLRDLKTYVYVYCEITEDNKRIPIYIGKGKGDRCFAHLNNLEDISKTKNRKITNHMGTIHVIAIANLCELAAGTLMEGFLHKSLRWIPKGMNIEYLKKANSRLNAIAMMPKNIEHNRKSDVAIPISVRDSNDTEVVRAEIIMYLTPK